MFRKICLLILLITGGSSFSGLAQQLSDVEIISRKEWQAKMPIFDMKEHIPGFITIHHTATFQKPEIKIEDKMKALQKFSQSESKLADGTPKIAWADVPYHFYIADNGKIAEGRDINYAGDTNTSYDPEAHILIVLEGNFEKEEVTAQQKKSLWKLIKALQNKYSIPSEEIGGHKDYVKTACPGTHLYSFISEFQTQNH